MEINIFEVVGMEEVVVETEVGWWCQHDEAKSTRRPLSILHRRVAISRAADRPATISRAVS